MSGIWLQMLCSSQAHRYPWSYWFMGHTLTSKALESLYLFIGCYSQVIQTKELRGLWHLWEVLFLKYWGKRTGFGFGNLLVFCFLCYMENKEVVLDSSSPILKSLCFQVLKLYNNSNVTTLYLTL